jgi:hypothetical protein
MLEQQSHVKRYFGGFLPPVGSSNLQCYVNLD